VGGNNEDERMDVVDAEGTAFTVGNVGIEEESEVVPNLVPFRIGRIGAGPLVAESAFQRFQIVVPDDISNIHCRHDHGQESSVLIPHIREAGKHGVGAAGELVGQDEAE
jgi:hypothetical protein